MTDQANGQADALAFGLLGPLRAARAGSALPLGGRQQKAVLALLLAEAGSAVSIARLADALWGERTPPGFATTVQTYVFHLREVLEPGRGRGVPGRVLVTGAGGYRLQADDDAIDARAFERLVASGQALLAAGAHAEASAELARALRLWRGEVLADLADYDFVAPLAGRLNELRLIAQESKIDADLALGRHAAALAELDQFIARNPLKERPHAQRMLALYRCGRQSDALAAYRDLHKLLDAELGIEPSPPLQQLHRAILAQDADLAWSAAPTSSAPAGVPLAAAGPAAPEPIPAVPPVRRRPARRRWVVGGSVATALLAIAVVTAVVVTHSPRSSLPALPGNSVGAVYADGSLHDAVTVGQSPDGLAYGAGALWATSATDDTVSRIDPASHTVVQTIPVGAAPTAVTVIGDQVWVANGGDGSVSWINAVNNKVVHKVAVGTLPAAIGSGPGGVWVANSGDGTVQRINPADGTAGKPIPVGAGPKGIAVTAGAVWVANSLALTVSRIDPATDRMTAVVAAGDGPGSVVAGPKRVWVGDEYDGTITEIDPATSHGLRRIAIGGAPRGLALVGSSLWVTSGAFTNSGHVGGTLTIDGGTSSLPGSLGIDPASNDVAPTVLAEGMVYDGLVGFRRTGGVAGLTLAPIWRRPCPGPPTTA